MTAALLPIGPACGHPDAEEWLNLYLDGELDAAAAPQFFGHLAACAGCRRQFESALAFRMAVRQEALPVSPAVDARVLARLDRSRRGTVRMRDRRRDRAPLGGALRQRVSVGAMLVITLVAVMAAALLPSGPAPAADGAPVRLARVVLDDGPIYLIAPGLTVEADRDARAVVDG